MSDTPAIASVEFTTADFRPHEQYDAWRGWHNQIFDGSPGARANDGFVARSNAVTMDGLALVRISMPATRVMRTPALIRRHPVDHWAVNMGLRSSTRLTAGGSTLEVPPRTPFVVSLADEMVSERGPDERIQLYLARESFQNIAPVLDAARGAVVPGPLGTMLAEFLELLDRNLRAIDPARSAGLRDAAGSMIAACLSPSPDRIASATAPLEAGRRERIRRVVRQNLRSPRFGPAELCGLTGMSRSAIYRLLEGDGGASRYIRRQRLLESRALLTDPSSDKPIAAVAEDFCFSDAGDFSRAFRREFGLTPSDARAAAKAGLILPAPRNEPVDSRIATFNDFIQSL